MARPKGRCRSVPNGRSAQRNRGQNAQDSKGCGRDLKRLRELMEIDGIDGIDGLFITEVLVITLFIVVMICCVFTFLNPSEIDDGNLGFTTPAVRLRFQSAHWLIQSWPEEGLALVTVKGKFPGKHVFLLCKDEGSSKFPYMCMRLSYCACLYI